MKIVVNGRFLCAKATGVQRFAFEISRHLKRMDPSIEILCPHNIVQTEWAEELDAKIIGSLKGHAWEQISLARHLKQQKSNPILFSPANTGPMGYTHQFLVMHDLAYIVSPKAYSWRFRLWYRFLTRHLTKRVPMIATVSDFTRKEIISYFPCVKEKIHVVYNGLSNFPQDIKPSSNNPYFLVVGSLYPRKNIPFIINAFSQLPSDNRPRLKLVGSTSRSFKREHYTNLPDDIELIGHANDYQLASLYANASALLFPSLYESFGLPPVEAMSFGTPCLVSDIPVLHEILNDAAIYLDPQSTNAWIDAMQTIIIDDELREELKEKGLSQSQKFNWERSALQVYNQLKLC